MTRTWLSKNKKVKSPDSFFVFQQMRVFQRITTSDLAICISFDLAQYPQSGNATVDQAISVVNH